MSQLFHRQAPLLLAIGLALGFSLGLLFIHLHSISLFSSTDPTMQQRCSLLCTPELLGSIHGDLELSNLASIALRWRNRLHALQREMRELTQTRALVIAELHERRQQLYALRRENAVEERQLNLLLLSTQVAADNEKRARLINNNRSSTILAPVAMQSCVDRVLLQSPDPESDEITLLNFSNCADSAAHHLRVGASCRSGDKLLTVWREAFERLPQSTVDPSAACLVVVLVCSWPDAKPSIYNVDVQSDSNKIIVPLRRIDAIVESTNGAIVVGSRVRRPLDILFPTPEFFNSSSGDVWRRFPMLTPAHRKHLLAFASPLPDLADPVAVTLSNWNSSFAIETKCEIDSTIRYETDEFPLCAERLALLRQATFSLIFWHTPSSDASIVRLLEAMRLGAVAVIVSAFPSPRLPLDELIQWQRAVITWPLQRLHYIPQHLASLDRRSILSLRRQSRFIYQAYFATPQRAAETIMSILRHRLHVAPPTSEFDHSQYSRVVHRQPGTFQALNETADEQQELVGPIELPRASPSYRFNCSREDADLRWNDWFAPFRLHASTPWQHERGRALPSEARFDSLTIRPLAGSDGAAFVRALGGDHDAEQFTIVMLTYRREEILLTSLRRLNGLAYLNRIIVVWNTEQDVPGDFAWPKLHVPLVVVKASHNSLNNRFLPFGDLIETDAVLAMDDDAFMHHDELVFGFRVWRENRERIVGFPARHHRWDSASGVGSRTKADVVSRSISGFGTGIGGGQWFYDSNYTCELSMVLTGIAFYHRYYANAYWSDDMEPIRARVDELTNCEDIAFNFLVAHLTRRAPVKVTSRWTFGASGFRDASLWRDAEHFRERHICVRFFSEVFGYTPLLTTQFRADSVLYKTRLPLDKQKCFKLV